MGLPAEHGFRATAAQERRAGDGVALPQRRRPSIPKVVLLIESSRASGRSLLTGVANYARHHGPWAFYWEPAGLERAWPHLKRLDAQGIIMRDSVGMDEVLGLGLPTVVFGHRRREVPGVVNVVTDSPRIGEMAAEHLLDRGLRFFAYCGFDGIPWSDARRESFCARVARAGCSADWRRAREGRAKVSWKQELLLMARWLQGLPKPLGLMACNDDRGQHVIEACKIAGLRVPEEVAVIGADNDELVCELSDPRMSSVAINFEAAGYACARALDRLMTGRRVVSSTILVRATHVATRHSTDMLAIADPAVSKVLRFIRGRSRQPIHVADVAVAAGLSRRVLEKRFRGCLNRSILGEIRRVRVEQICRMLVETNQPVTQIALTLGYAGVEHIARYFRRETGMTPLAYRKVFGPR